MPRATYATRDALDDPDVRQQVQDIATDASPTPPPPPEHPMTAFGASLYGPALAYGAPRDVPPVDIGRPPQPYVSAADVYAPLARGYQRGGSQDNAVENIDVRNPAFDAQQPVDTPPTGEQLTGRRFDAPMTDTGFAGQTRNPQLNRAALAGGMQPLPPGLAQLGAAQRAVYEITGQIPRAIGSGQSALDIVTVGADKLIPGPGQGTLGNRFDAYRAQGMPPDQAANAALHDYGQALGKFAETPSASGDLGALLSRGVAQGARVAGTVQSLTAPAPVPGGASAPFAAGILRGAGRLGAEELAGAAERYSARLVPGTTSAFEVFDNVAGKATATVHPTEELAQAQAARLNAAAKPYDQNAVSVTAAVRNVPETINSDLRKMLRGEIPQVAPAEVTADKLAASPEMRAVLDDALKANKAEVNDANRLSLAQQVIDAQAVRNKIIVAKGYRNVPELPPDAPVIAEAAAMPDGGAGVFDRTRQVLDEAKGSTYDRIPGEPPSKGPIINTPVGPRNLPELPPGSARSFGLRDLGQLATEVMYNGIVFPTTNLVHTMGSLASSVAQFPEQVLLAGADKALSMVGITKTRNFTIESAVAGLNAQAHGIGNAIAHDVIPNIVHGSESLVDRDVPREVSTAMLRGEYGSGPLVKVLGAVAKVAAEGNYPLRTIAAIDDTLRRGLSASSLIEQGYRDAYAKGLAGDAAHAHAAQFVNEAGPSELAIAEDEAKRQINRQAPGAIGSRILDIKGLAGPVGTVLLPFFNTKLNILKAATTWSPLGFGRLLPKKTPVLGYFAQKTMTEADRVQALTRATAGTMLLVPVWQQVLSDNITGDGPTDPRAKAQWVGDPSQPSHVERAIRTPFGWVTYGKVPVIGDYIAAIADAAQAVRENKASDVSGAQAAVSGLVQYFAHEEQGLMDAVSTIAAAAEAWKDPNNAQAQAVLAQELANRGFQLTPFSGAIRAEQTIAGEPYKRIPPGTKGLVNRTLEQYRAQIPGANADMPNGAQRVPGISAGAGALLPIRVAPDAPPVQGTATGIPPTASAESARLAAAIKDFKPIALPTNKIGVGKPYELTLSGNAYLDFSRAVGDARNDAINKLLVTPAYQNAADSIKARLYTLAVSSADRIGEQNYLRNGVLTSSDPEQTRNDALLLMTQGTLADRAKWAGLMQQSGKLTAETRAAIDAARPDPLPGQHPAPTMAEYVHAAPLVSQYLALPPYLQGNPQEWEALKVAKARLSDAELKVKQTGTYLPPTALHYQAMATLSPADQQLILKYPPVLVNPARRVFLEQHPEVGRFVGQ